MLLDRANQLMQLGRYEAALAILQEQIADGDSKLASELIGQCLVKLERFHEAKAFLTDCISQYPEDPLFRYLLSLTYENLDRPRKAERFMKSAIKLAPALMSFRAVHARQLISWGRPEEAAKIASAAIQHAPDQARLHLWYGLALSEMGNVKSALHSVNRALEIDPGDKAAKSIRSMLMLKAHPEQARKDAFDVLAQNPHDRLAKVAALEALSNQNFFFKFLTGNGFSKYAIKWDWWHVVLVFVLWKALLICGSLFLIYMLLTWYGRALLNTILRFHEKYNLLLNEEDIWQSNAFLIGNAMILLLASLQLFFSPSHSVFINLLLIAGFTLFWSVSYTEILTKSGKQWAIGFFILSLLLIGTLFSASQVMWMIVPFLTILYGVLFTLRILVY